jgi:hypothetical protein
MRPTSAKSTFTKVCPLPSQTSQNAVSQPGLMGLLRMATAIGRGKIRSWLLACGRETLQFFGPMDLHQLVPEISEHNKITGYMSLYKVEPKIYRAGVSLARGPKNLPEGLQYAKVRGGKYSRFVLTGPYSDLPQACGRVFEIVSETVNGMAQPIRSSDLLRLADDGGLARGTVARAKSLGENGDEVLSLY